MKKKSATKKELQIKLDSIRSDLIWDYGYYFKRYLESIEKNDMNEFIRSYQMLKYVMNQLHLHFNFNYEVMLKSLNR